MNASGMSLMRLHLGHFGSSALSALGPFWLKCFSLCFCIDGVSFVPVVLRPVPQDSFIDRSWVRW